MHGKCPHQNFQIADMKISYILKSKVYIRSDRVVAMIEKPIPMNFINLKRIRRRISDQRPPKPLRTTAHFECTKWQLMVRSINIDIFHFKSNHCPLPDCSCFNFFNFVRSQKLRASKVIDS